MLKAHTTKWLTNKINKILSYKNRTIISLNHSWQREAVEAVKKTRNIVERVLMTDVEAYQLYIWAKSVEKISGYMADIGCFQGGSTMIMRSASSKVIFAFDTFEGLPSSMKREEDGGRYKEGKLRSSYDKVKELFENDKNTFIYKGICPETADPVKNKNFSFINLDVDLYQSTLDCLEFFYPRMTKGGLIICHDYTRIGAVKKAIDLFFKDKLEVVLCTAGSTQSMIVKS